MSIFYWLILGLSLLIGSFGFSGFVTLVLAICLFLFGFLLSIRWIYKSESEEWWLSVHQSQIELPKTGIQKVIDSMPCLKAIEKTDQRITGSSLIDEQLHIVVEYFIRDFISPWYSKISHDDRLIIQFRKNIQEVLIAISCRCKDADWVGYLTTRLVDDLTSHIHLFQDAKASVKLKSKSTSKDLIDQFFDKEVEKEKDICRDQITLKPEAEKDYLSDLVEVLLYFILRDQDFENVPLRAALIEILVSHVILPLANKLADPNYVNPLIVCACTEFPVSSELFIYVIKFITDIEELEAVRRMVVAELKQLRSHDSGGREEGTEVKQQIASLEYLRKTIDMRMKRLDKGSETDSLGMPVNYDHQHLIGKKLFQLPLEVILKNSLALDHFLNYMASVNCQHYVNLYLNIECWKTSVSERLCALELEHLHHQQEMGNGASMPGIRHNYFSSHDLSSHKSESEVIYEQYLSEKANPRVVIGDSVVKRLILRMRSEKINENWFDEVQQELFCHMKDTELFLPAFRRSPLYIRLLAELDLLKDVLRSDDEDSPSLSDLPLDQGEEATEGSLHASSGGSRGSSCSHSPQASRNPSPCHTRTSSFSSRQYSINAVITGTDIVKEGSRSHAVYKVEVQYRDHAGGEEVWAVFRRYSEFHDFHQIVSAKFLDLSSIPFPSKKMLNNLAAWFLEKRLKELNEWLSNLVRPSTIQSHPGLQDMIFRFLDNTLYHSSQHSTNLVRKVEDNLMAPIRVGVKSVSDAVKIVPDTVDVLYRKLVKSHSSRFASSSSNLDNKCSVDIESEENIPLRILLQLMDEVFELRSKDQWFRRRLILFLRQILKAMFGDIVNRRIVEFVGFLVSPEQVAYYIKCFKEMVWPGGKLSLDSPPRDKDTYLRAKTAAKACMLASISGSSEASVGVQVRPSTKDVGTSTSDGNSSPALSICASLDLSSSSDDEFYEQLRKKARLEVPSFNPDQSP